MDGDEGVRQGWMSLIFISYKVLIEIGSVPSIDIASGVFFDIISYHSIPLLVVPYINSKVAPLSQ